MKRIISLLLCVGMMLSIAACSKKATMTWQEQYDLGVRYLSEGNYKEAIIAFESAITIDPQQADGYARLAEAYIRANDFENAARVVSQGIEACGESDSFTLLLSQIHLSELLHNGMTENMLQREELNFFGHNIDSLSFQESTKVLQQRGYEDSGFEADWDGKIDYLNVDVGNGTQISVSESSDRIEWLYVDTENVYPIGIRTINTGDTMENVFTKLGFSNGQEISDCIVNIAESEIISALGSDDSVISPLVYKKLSDECILVLDVYRQIVNVCFYFEDTGHNKYSELVLSFRCRSNSASLPDSLNWVCLHRGDIPSSITYG